MSRAGDLCKLCLIGFGLARSTAPQPNPWSWSPYRTDNDCEALAEVEQVDRVDDGLMRLVRRTLAVIALLAAAAWLAVFLAGQGLERASSWASVLSLFLTVVATVAGVGALWLTAIGVRDARRHAAQQSSVARIVNRESSTSLHKAWNIPAPSRTFAGRQKELSFLNSEMHGHSARRAVVLYGLPGVGKTQLATAYADRQRAHVQVGWWIKAGSRQTALVALSELADRLGVGNQDQGRAARQALEELRKRKNWLVVFDGAHNPADLIDLVPTGDGEVLITSLNPGWDAVAVPVRVEPFDKNQAAQFLQQRTEDKDPSSAALLGDELGGIPLALEQAAAYCRQAHMSLAAYLTQYQLDRTRLLERGIPSDYQLPVTVTWQRSFQLAGRKAAAAQLLRVFAYIDPSNIPRDLPAYGARLLPRALRRVTLDSVSLNDTIAILSSFSLITADQSGQEGTLRIHRLVQDVVRGHIPSERPPLLLRIIRRLVGVARLARRVAFDSSSNWSARRWSRAVIYMLHNALPDAGDPRNWGRYGELLPHCLAALHQTDQLGDSSLEVANLQSAVASYLLLRADFESARVWESRALKIIHARLGDRNPRTLLSMQNLANILKAQNRFSEARQLERYVLDIRMWRGQLHRRRFGDHDQDTLRAMNNLAITTYAEGDLLESRKLNEEILAARRRSLGDAHPDTLFSVQNLADILHEMGELASSRQLAESAIATISQTSKDPIAIRAVQNNLALVFRDQGELVRARQLLEQMHADDKVLFGEDYIMTLQTASNLASVLRLEGKLAEARKLLEGALPVLERSYGSDNPITLQASTNLARVLRDQGEATDARQLLEKTLEARKRIYGEDHFLTRPLTADLAQMVHDQGSGNETRDE